MPRAARGRGGDLTGAAGAGKPAEAPPTQARGQGREDPNPRSVKAFQALVGVVGEREPGVGPREATPGAGQKTSEPDSRLQRRLWLPLPPPPRPPRLEERRLPARPRRGDVWSPWAHQLASAAEGEKPVSLAVAEACTSLTAHRAKQGTRCCVPDGSACGNPQGPPCEEAEPSGAEQVTGAPPSAMGLVLSGKTPQSSRPYPLLGAHGERPTHLEPGRRSLPVPGTHVISDFPPVKL
ncbi:uncharacterized protein LOC123817210 [Phyllostomus hastatus]|uniref:uncharacterized protein LOC123817210 n=1 Tax=Phyllostomus hastatus TaxID=9423 RepID=UPI001E6833B3|nr:uncharacterized protein LOC123817210 [Phyllostomus hastatus]